MISFEEAKTHLRVTHSEDDADISQKLFMAKAIVKGYAGEVDVLAQAAAVADAIATATPTEAAINAANEAADKAQNASAIADAAVLMVLGELYMNREAGCDPLSPSVRVFLSHLRKPALA